jgi:hypothetical protein
MKKLHAVYLSVVAATFIIFFNFYPAAHAATFYVGSGESFLTIQSAISAAGIGDNIIVKDGIYDGDTIEIRKSLTLRSENGSSNTTLNFGFSILADAVTVDGFKINAGISIGSYDPEYATDNIMANNVIKNGIGLTHATNNTISGNNFPSGAGIALNLNNDGNTISFNTFRGTGISHDLLLGFGVVSPRRLAYPAHILRVIQSIIQTCSSRKIFKNR